jgi:paraquat-inducible protein A
MRRAVSPVMVKRGQRAFVIFILTLSAGGCLVLGLTLPILKLTRLYFWTDTHSILSVLSALWAGGEIFLASVVFVFSILFPAFKLIYIGMAGTLTSFDPAQRGRWFKRIGWLGKWSMLDVLILALLVFYAKATEFADAISLPGVYFFSASVFLTMIANSLIGSEEAPVERRELS